MKNRAIIASKLRRSLVLWIAVLVFISSCARIKPGLVDHLRLGYLLNMTHAVALVGLETQSFSETEGVFFSSGGYLLNALLTNNVDLAYIGPGPYLNALQKGIKLKLLRVCAIGGNSLILADGFNPDESFVISRLAVPQLGNTQDLLAKILVKKLLARSQRIQIFKKDHSDLDGLERIQFSNKLEYIPVNPAELEVAFYTAVIDSALVVEPWGTMLESRGLVNAAKLVQSKSELGVIEALDSDIDLNLKDSLEYINKFPTTLLVVEEGFYERNKERVDIFVKQQDEILEAILSSKDSALVAIKVHLEKNTHKAFAEEFLRTSFNKIKFSSNLDKSKLEDLVQIAREVKYFRKDLSL